MNQNIKSVIDVNLMDYTTFDGQQQTIETPINPDPIYSLTDAEKNILNNLAIAYSLFSQLPDHGPTETIDFTAAMNTLQYIIGYRVARRIDPKIWA